jgi:hypothetical protein
MQRLASNEAKRLAQDKRVMDRKAGDARRAAEAAAEADALGADQIKAHGDTAAENVRLHRRCRVRRHIPMYDLKASVSTGIGPNAAAAAAAAPDVKADHPIAVAVAVAIDGNGGGAAVGQAAGAGGASAVVPDGLFACFHSWLLSKSASLGSGNSDQIVSSVSKFMYDRFKGEPISARDVFALLIDDQQRRHWYAHPHGHRTIALARPPVMPWVSCMSVRVMPQARTRCSVWSGSVRLRELLLVHLQVRGLCVRGTLRAAGAGGTVADQAARRAGRREE